MRVLMLFLLTSLLTASLHVEAQTIEQFSLCRNVEDLNPISPATAFNKGEKAYCWLKVKGAKPNSHIFLDWYWEGKLQHASKLTLTYAAQRTYGYKTMTLNGTWKVAVRNADNKVLYEMSFQAGEGKDIDPALAKKKLTGPSVIVMNPPKPKEGNNGTDKIRNIIVSTPPKEIPAPAPKLILPSITQRASQSVENPIREKSRLLLPNANASDTVPLVVMLPFTGGTAANLYSGYLYNVGELVDDGQEGTTAQFQAFIASVSPKRPFALLLPAGIGSTDDHTSLGFSNAILRYEQRLFADIQRLQATMNISKVILCGYSLGGDLSWALMMRNPSLLDGAIVMGSRCGYMEAKHLPVLSSEGVKYFLFTGSEEEELRFKGMQWAKWQLDKANIDYLYSEGQGLGHATIPESELPKAFRFVLE